MDYTYWYPVLLKIKQALDWAKLGEGKGAQEPKAQTARVCPSFVSMKHA